ncbi:MAG: hypothetical protein Tsb0014_45210 [Pleurocapsa sp.]
MKAKSKQTYNKPKLLIHGSLEEITKQGGGKGIDGIIGIDIDGDGNVDIGTGVSIGSL